MAKNRKRRGGIVLNDVTWSNIATIQDIYLMLYEYVVNLIGFKNLPGDISERYILQTLIEKGDVCFYISPSLNKLVALYAANIEEEDIYGNPQTVMTSSRNGLIHEIVRIPEDGILVWATKPRVPIVYRLNMTAKRLFNIKRTIDVVLAQMRAPRVLSVPSNQRQTVLNLIEQVDEARPWIVVDQTFQVDAWKDLDLGTQPNLQQLYDAWRAELNSFFNYCGIQSSIDKKERLVSNESLVMNEPTMFARKFIFEEVQSCIDMVNEKFDTEIEVVFSSEWAKDEFELIPKDVNLPVDERDD